MPPSVIDLGVVARFRAASGGERSAIFEEIFRVHHDPVFGLCCRLCGNPALAEDAVQETFVEVYKGVPLFRGEASLGTWIYRVAMRTALRLRARARLRRPRRSMRFQRPPIQRRLWPRATTCAPCKPRSMLYPRNSGSSSRSSPSTV